MNIRGICFLCDGEISQNQSMVHIYRKSGISNIKAHRICEASVFAKRGKELYTEAVKVQNKTKELSDCLKNFYMFD